mmetsp:Transcript_17595/g.42328  ORF Transcript_17595/g.42328 Transcript_17595/m.42328 type:complete len:144 (+) Transcript_17595:128-559(+)|eukprot:CAMPEP_0181117440 /NCGR_PEP_ID=MMETSP1071-20121207/22521_1 /TAXON_ID=35127 /ORGANISM="Thalassiosira sp., Strain NH16" /LENGTH=143 /DNA_ID=CAMNT_0023201823 /DNA_START=88 /DNA_END=519 /DNA_ORIENTATION=+
MRRRLSADLLGNPVNRASFDKRTTHLELPANDDVDRGKIHKCKSTSQATITLASLCGLVALCTLFYFSNTVLIPDGKVSASIGKRLTSGYNLLPQKERLVGQQNRILPPDSIYRTKVKDIHDDWQQLMKYSGSVSLVVNVACE